VTYRWDELPEWQRQYMRRLGLTRWPQYGEDGPRAWCEDSTPAWPTGPRRGSVTVGGSHLWIDPMVWARAAAARPPWWRRWARRCLWWATRELRRLLDRIDAQTRERGE
jgi:hypothetical protein